MGIFFAKNDQNVQNFSLIPNLVSPLPNMAWLLQKKKTQKTQKMPQ